jgi:hypothetical protein
LWNDGPPIFANAKHGFCASIRKIGIHRRSGAPGNGRAAGNRLHAGSYTRISTAKLSWDLRRHDLRPNPATNAALVIGPAPTAA